MAWYASTLGLLVLLLVHLSVLEYQKYTRLHPKTPVFTRSTIPTLNIATGKGTAQFLGSRITAADARGMIVQKFIKDNYHGENGEYSPLLPFADIIVQKADEYAIDFRILPAIASCESNLGKRVPLRTCHNAWGIAVYTGTQEGACFSDWPTAIDWVSKYVKNKYFSAGITDIHDIGSIWAPPSVETGGSWGKCVMSFLKSMQ